mgnify:CR=1 FL=1
MDLERIRLKKIQRLVPGGDIEIRAKISVRVDVFTINPDAQQRFLGDVGRDIGIVNVLSDKIDDIAELRFVEYTKRLLVAFSYLFRQIIHLSVKIIILTMLFENVSLIIIIINKYFYLPLQELRKTIIFQY